MPESNQVPPPPTNAPLVDANGFLTQIWQGWINSVFFNTIQGLITQVSDLEAEVSRNSISSSNTVPTAIIAQVDNGVDVTVTMLSHERQYDDGKRVTVNTDFINGPYGSTIGMYYDDVDRNGGDVNLEFSTDIAITRANYVPGRHSLGTLLLIGAGDPPPPDSGGIIPPGWNPDFPIP